MRNFKKALASVVLGGVCALSFTMAACGEESTTPTNDDHEHTYSTDWVYNSTQHWHAASCEDTNSVSEQAAHADDDNDGVCDVCGYNYDHTHVYSNEWSSDGTSHWHEALCGHTTTSDTAAHTTNAAGVCTVCGYQAGTPDVSSVESALAVAEVQSYLAEHGEGTISYYNDIYGRTSNYSLSYDIYEDYTYIYYSTSSSTTETWNSLTQSGSVFSVVSSNGSTPTLNTEEVPVEALNGYAFNDGLNITGTTYYGITNLVVGLYENAVYYGYLDEDSLTVPGEDSDVYSFTLSNYVMGYTGTNDETRYQANDVYYVVTVEFTLSTQNYIDSVSVIAETYDSDCMTFEDDESAGTLIEGVTPYIRYTYTLEQGGRNPYVYEEVTMSSFDFVDENGNVVSGDTDVEAIQIAPYNSTTLSIANILPTTADTSLDAITRSLEKYNEESDEYESINIGYTTVNAYYYSSTGRLTITGYAEGIYRLTLKSANVTTYINIIVSYPAPTEISATANGTATDSYNTYTGVSVTIAGSVTYGYATGYTVEITSDNADDATLTSSSTGYTFSSDVVGTYTLTVTSTADESVSDTITIVIAEAPSVSEVLNGNYVYDITDDYTGDFESNVYVGFTPDSEGALTGTFSYYIQTYWYGTFSGSTTYTYDSETGAITLGEGAESISLSLVSYAPVVTLTGTSYGRTWTITISGFVATDEAVPGGSGSGSGSGSESGADDSDILAAITDWVWWNNYYDVGIRFESTTSSNSGSGYITDGYYEYYVYFEWEYSDGVLTLYPASDTGDVDSDIGDFAVSTETVLNIEAVYTTDWWGDTVLSCSFEYNGETFYYDYYIW